MLKEAYMANIGDSQLNVRNVKEHAPEISYDFVIMILYSNSKKPDKLLIYPWINTKGGGEYILLKDEVTCATLCIISIYPPRAFRRRFLMIKEKMCAKLWLIVPVSQRVVLVTTMTTQAEGLETRE